MSCFTESENCKYELNKSSSLVDVSLSTPVPESSAVKKTSVSFSSEVISHSTETKYQQKDNGHLSLNSSTTSDGSFFLNRINHDESKESIGDSQITLTTPPEPTKTMSSGSAPTHSIMMSIGGANTSSIVNQSLMRSVDLDDSESKQGHSVDRNLDEEYRIFEEGEEPLPYEEEENDNQEEDEETEEREETEEERIRRENEESERLAWELMQEEQNAAYQAQVDFLNQNVHNFSEEDRAALALVMQESANVIRQNNALSRNDSQEDGSDGGDGEEEEDDEDAWTGGEHYERLLELGHVLGDVKTERWRLRADSVIAELPTVTYKQIQEEHVDKDSSSTNTTHATTGSGEKKRKLVRTLDVKCSVCMETFEKNDELTLLPVCRHYFHVDCAKGWLKDHNSCPICKVKVSSPEK